MLPLNDLVAQPLRREMSSSDIVRLPGVCILDVCKEEPWTQLPTDTTMPPLHPAGYIRDHVRTFTS